MIDSALLAQVEALGVTEESLDDLVIDAHARMASTVNNRGMEGQLAFLVEYAGGVREAAALLKGSGG